MCNNCVIELTNEIEEYINYQTGEVLDLEKVSKLKDNVGLKINPNIWCEWNFEKNGELGFDIWEMTKGSKKKAWFNCIKCKSDCLQDYQFKVNGVGCPYCRGLKANHTNSLATLNPELALEWHPTLNGDLTPHDVTSKSNKKVWWLGTCGHEWEAKIANKTNGTKCPYCSPFRKKVLKGFNDMWTTNPELAKLLANPDDGYNYTYGSHAKVDWKCQDCGEIIKNKTICDINIDGLSCNICSDSVSYGEKITYNTLKALNINFETQKRFKWLSNRYYDFYIPSLNVIIETHGIQHYKQTTRKGARTLQEEQSNDKYKYDLAIQNGIKPENYIVIDCRKSEIMFIKENILSSKLNEILDLSTIDWEIVIKNAKKSNHIKFLELWENGLTLAEISKETGVTRDTISRVLRNFTSIGICDYKSRKKESAL